MVLLILPLVYVDQFTLLHTVAFPVFRESSGAIVVDGPLLVVEHMVAPLQDTPPVLHPKLSPLLVLGNYEAEIPRVPVWGTQTCFWHHLIGVYTTKEHALENLYLTILEGKVRFCQRF